MKVLLDTCISSRVAADLRQSGFDVISTAEWEKDPGDPAIMDFAASEERILVTLDKDFGELAVRDRRQHSGLIRLSGIQPDAHAEIIESVIRAHCDQLLLGAIIVVDSKRIRIRMP